MHDIAPPREAIDAIVQARHGDPFAVLGPHDTQDGLVVRACLPDADAVELLRRRDGTPIGALQCLHPNGFWQGMASDTAPYRLRVTQHGVTYETEDPYSFGPLLGDIDLHLLGEGRHREIGRVLGAHPMVIDGIAGTRFAVWAPNASRVSVVGDFNGWDGRRHPMRLRHGAGVWEIFIPRVSAGALYKYELLDAGGTLLPLKADPCAWATERPPATASRVADAAELRWNDADWCASRGRRQALDAPLSIYEVHALSWLPDSEAGGFDWAALADRLVPYVQRLGFTHIELMPIMEHPFRGSWGYQPLAQFAPTSRLGSPAAFAFFVDRCHAAGIGVLLDWVPAHFPTDAHGLARFDGTALYEHADPREGFHQDWNTLIYNLARHEVRGFLIGSALHWLEHFHIDGLRVDAVASMLYRDYSRQPGEWVPNRYGGRENLEAIGFFRELSEAIAERAPGALLIAEESTAFPRVSQPAATGGLGFDYKWNMGWMHDTLHYMAERPEHRRWHHSGITFGLLYAFSEYFVLPLSHDEVVYGKGSLIGKMPGDAWQRFANLRAYLAFMWSYPGKKLLFMGCEFAQEREWNHDRGLDWFLLDQPAHRGIQTLVSDLNAAYRAQPALHAGDVDSRGFGWVVVEDAEQSVFAYLRHGSEADAPVLAVCNFTPVPRHDYRIGVPRAGIWREIVNTDAIHYGGSGLGNAGAVTADPVPSHGMSWSVSLVLPPLATLFLQPA